MAGTAICRVSSQDDERTPRESHQPIPQAFAVLADNYKSIFNLLVISSVQKCSACSAQCELSQKAQPPARCSQLDPRYMDISVSYGPLHPYTQHTGAPRPSLPKRVKLRTRVLDSGCLAALAVASASDSRPAGASHHQPSAAWAAGRAGLTSSRVNGKLHVAIARRLDSWSMHGEREALIVEAQ
jgi:hypothetical protein